MGQDRLILVDKSEKILARHISGRENARNARNALSFARVHIEKAGMRFPAPEDAKHQRPIKPYVLAENPPALSQFQGADSWYGFSDLSGHDMVFSIKLDCLLLTAYSI